jgi:hypothetical protein
MMTLAFKLIATAWHLCQLACLLAAFGVLCLVLFSPAIAMLGGAYYYGNYYLPAHPKSHVANGSIQYTAKGVPYMKVPGGWQRVRF